MKKKTGVMHKIGDDDQITRWAEYVKSHQDWKKIHTKFINAQFKKHEEIIKKILSQPDGREKIIRLYNVKNLNAFKGILA